MIAVKITEDYQSQNEYEGELIFIEIIHLRCKKYSKRDPNDNKVQRLTPVLQKMQCNKNDCRN